MSRKKSTGPFPSMLGITPGLAVNAGRHCCDVDVVVVVAVVVCCSNEVLPVCIGEREGLEVLICMGEWEGLGVRNSVVDVSAPCCCNGWWEGLSGDSVAKESAPAAMSSDSSEWERHCKGSELSSLPARRT